MSNIPEHKPHTSTEQLYQAPSAPFSQASLVHTPPNDETWYHFSGRIGRLRYLSYQLFITILFYLAIVVFIAIFALVSDASQLNEGLSFVDIILIILFIPLYLANLIYSVIIYPKRRLNDLGYSGWLALLMFVPLINLFFILYLIFARGNEGVNQYGAPPRENRTIHYIAGLIGPVLFAVFIIGILAAIAIPAYDDYVQRAHEVSIQQTH
ncbi:DUF805 domain-containing protein [Psychrobacter sp. I-STPA6b]|uniref:DUF805 domain-containing protein n=1 Tax=Psychrobacter sp. I-STPA6b TaxID=2585718 RepID=UPI001D0BF940|nr:DUF805 domain-containing protein [Psychrobacter sp. I-STPA6b]